MATFQIPPLPVGFGFPIQFVLESTRNFEDMFPVTQAFFETAQTRSSLARVEDPAFGALDHRRKFMGESGNTG